MADVFTQPKRSAVMARIWSRGNRDTELALARLLRAHGITGWRRHVCVALNRDSLKTLNRKKYPASSTKSTVRPDFVFFKKRVAIFVDGCFWHGCPIHSPPARWLRSSSMPVTACSRKNAKAQRTGKQFWRQKLAANIARDRLVARRLRRAGWRLLRIWEHELRCGDVRPARLECSSRRDTPTTVRLVRRIQEILGGPR